MPINNFIMAGSARKNLAQRWTDEQIIEEYPVLKKEDIEEALYYAEMLIRNEEIYPLFVGK